MQIVPVIYHSLWDVVFLYVIGREFVFCIFYSSIFYIVYGGCFMVRAALMRVGSGNYRAARYLNSFVIVPVSLAGVVPIWFAQLDRLESAAIAVMLCRGCICRAQGCLSLCLKTQ